MRVLVATLVMGKAPYVVHGAPLALGAAAAFVGHRAVGPVRTYSWLWDAWRPHACGVAGCGRNRAWLRRLWARVAQRLAVHGAAARALAARLPPDLVPLVLGRVVHAERVRRDAGQPGAALRPGLARQ